MKPHIKLALAFALCASTALAADPVEGVWKTGVEDGGYGHVQIATCGGAFCGKVIRSYKEDGSLIRSNADGQFVITDMVPVGEGNYEGRAMRPGTAKTYIAKMAITESTMKMSGCVLGGVICIGQTWARVD